MKELEIVEESVLSGTTKLTKEEAIAILRDIGTLNFIKSYKVSEDFILDNFNLFDRNIIIEGLNFTESFVNKALSMKYLKSSDIFDLSMTTYSTLSSIFLINNKENINWTRMITYLSTVSDDFSNYFNIIDENNLWGFISSNDLPIDFIRSYKDKLDWYKLSMVKYFTDDEYLEFKDYIKYTVDDIIEDKVNIDITDISVDDIDDMISKLVPKTVDNG